MLASLGYRGKKDKSEGRKAVWTANPGAVNVPTPPTIPDRNERPAATPAVRPTHEGRDIVGGHLVFSRPPRGASATHTEVST